MSFKPHRTHPYLDGNFAPIDKTVSQFPCQYDGTIPKEFLGGQYVRNGGNPTRNKDGHQEAHWFDGDGMLSGVFFRHGDSGVQPEYANQYILSDIHLATAGSTLSAPILPSVAALVHPTPAPIRVFFKIFRAVCIIFSSFIGFMSHPIKRISSVNTSIFYHDGRVLASCEIGPPMRVCLPSLKTVGWFTGWRAEGEAAPANPSIESDPESEPILGGKGIQGFYKEWTTAHPRVDPQTGELVMFHSTVIPPFVLYSIVPPKQEQGNTEPFLSRPVPGIASAKLMHDFGVSQQHTIVIDLPLSLDQSNLKHNKPVIAYDHTGKTRFGVFPRYSPEVPEWLETEACCIIHTVNSWDEIKGNASNVHMLVCRMNNVSQLYHMGNIEAPVIPNQPEPECRLYYYQFQLEPGSPKIAQQWALSAIPFEFPHVPKGHSMSAAQFVYGCSMRHGNFAGLVVESIKMDCLVKINVQSLLKRAAQNPPTAVSGCVDSRSISQILSSNPIEDDPIQVFSLPDGWYAQECAFVPRAGGISEDDGWLITYVFDESQLDEQGIAPENARSQLWIIDAKGMKDIVARVFLPQRVPYGMHGCWFSEDEILNQLEIQQFRG